MMAIESSSGPTFPASFDRTKKVLAMMLCENTGRALCDSGDAYGRNWERNRRTQVWEKPATTLEVRLEHDGKAFFDVTHNVFHWLVECCTYDRAMTKRLRKLGEREGIDGLELCERFPEYLAETGLEVGGIYGEGSPVTHNTYNGESCLSQVLQFTYFTIDQTSYVALQIHGGADVRGGYTDPVVFETSDNYGFDVFDGARATIAPNYAEVKARQAEIDKQSLLFPDDSLELSEVMWSTDDANSWYFQGTCGRDYDSKQLDNMPAKEIADRSEWERGVVCILPDGSALCPFSGCTLMAGY